MASLDPFEVPDLIGTVADDTITSLVPGFAEVVAMGRGLES